MASNNTDDGSVTVVTSRRVKPGHEAAFEEWLDGIGAGATRHPGFVWRRVTRPKDHDRPEWVTVFKFDSYESLRGWTESFERRDWLERVKPHVLDDFKETVLRGLERWFTAGDAGRDATLRSLIASVTLIVLLTWVVMPRVTRLFARCTHRNKRDALYVAKPWMRSSCCDGLPVRFSRRLARS